MNISVMNFDACKLDVSPTGRTSCSVSAYDVDGATVLENFEVEQVVSHFVIERLLEEIGEQAARDWLESLA